ncbi:MAG TPA: molybdenum cofactor guanylyltransferase [Candidatus Polarisedimenticolia bacterium]
MILHPHVTGVVLAGGRASRLGGADKASLRLGADPADTTLTRILEVFSGRFTECLIVTAPGRFEAPVRREGLMVRATTDRIADCGPLGGIDAALRAVLTPLAFICGCDMPSLSGELIDLMVSRCRPDRLLVPVLRGRPEPLHALYPISRLPEVERALADGIRMMLDFFERVPVDYLAQEEYAGIDGAERSFMNINTPEDLGRARA